MLKTNSFIAYCIEFHATRDYFECHEIMEEYWKASPKDEYEPLWLALIQLAVAQYHHRRLNIRGAKIMYTSALEKFKIIEHSINEIDIPLLCQNIEERLNHINTHFIDINIAIKDKQLYKACLMETNRRGLKWCTSSSEIEQDVINRHLTRDRTEVNEERRRALIDKQKNRANN